MLMLVHCLKKDSFSLKQAAGAYTQYRVIGVEFQEISSERRRSFKKDWGLEGIREGFLMIIPQWEFHAEKCCKKSCLNLCWFCGEEVLVS